MELTPAREVPVEEDHTGATDEHANDCDYGED